MPEPPILDAAALDLALCEVPDCTYAGHPPLTLVAPCHPWAAFRVTYHGSVLTVACDHCWQPVTRVAVARRQNA